MNAFDLQQYLRVAGWPENLIVTMAAIGLAESRGNPQAHNAKPPDDSYGLWQINMLGNLGPARRRQFGINSNSDLFDPLTNAKAALAIYSQQGLRAWSTYTNGLYQRFIPQSQAVYQPGATATVPIAESVPDDDSDNYADSSISTDNNTSLLIAGAGAVLLLLLLSR